MSAPAFLIRWAEETQPPLSDQLRTLAADAAGDQALDDRIEADYRFLGLWTRQLQANVGTIRLDSDQLSELASLVAQHLREPAEDRWYKTASAATYLGIHRDTLRTLTAQRRIRFHQERPGTTLHFKRSWLDAYRDGSQQA